MMDSRPPEDESQSFGDLLTFNLVPPTGHVFHLSGKIFTNFATKIYVPQQIPRTLVILLGEPFFDCGTHEVHICG